MKKHYFLRERSARWFRQSLLALSSLGLALTSVAQTTLTIGTGNNTNASAPIAGYYGYTYSQNIYYASEIIAAGGGMGTISKIRFRYASGGNGANSNNWTVYIGHTTKTGFTSNTDWVSVASLTNCFSGTFTMPGAGNWVEITLSTPFQWDGTRNLLIAVDENQANYASATMNWSATATTPNRCISYFADATNPNPASPPTANGTYGNLPNLQIDWLTAPDCAGTPAHSNALVSDASICPAENTTFSTDQFYFGLGYTYQWQSNDGSGWTDIAGATGATYTGTLAATSDVRVEVACSFSAMSDISESVNVVVNPNPNVVIDHTDIATCNGEPANLTASGADTYLWSPNTLLTPNTTSAAVNVIPATTTTYTVVGTTAAGCSASATSKITPVTQVTTQVTYDPSENCEPGSPVTVEVIGLPSEITSGGTWEYRWLASDGVTVLQDWNSSSSYTFIPTEDSVYGHFYQVRSTSCPMDYVDSVYTEIAIGFGADVELTPYNCNTMGGTIELIDPFGQTTISELYSNPLSDAGNIPNITLSGNASITNGRAQLTASATGVTGYASLDIPDFTPGMNNSFTISFDMTADQPINTYGTGGADGLAYSFGDDATPAANGSGMNGKGSKLRLSFDAANNGTENGNATGIYLVYGWNSGTAFGPGSTPQVLAYSPNTALWKIQTDVPVTLSIDNNGKATVTVNGTVVFDHIQLPAAYMNADVSNWKHLFSAQTGGDAMRQAVSNLSIESGYLNYGITAGGSATPPGESEWQSVTTFEDLLPGTYDIWISKDTLGTCVKNIGTFEILNTNPIVDLGNDTTICEGETLLLDAGNPGSVYTWSGSNTYTQTMEVSEEGNYVVYVTDPQGCLGIGSINVDVNDEPSATGINVQGSFPNLFFAVTGAQNVDTYDWNFDDGTTLDNGPASVTHVYTTDGTFDVTVTVSNDCGTQTYTETITIEDVTGIGENAIEGLEVYPNPATQNVTVKLPNSEEAAISVYSISGALVQAESTFHSAASFDVSGWEKGVYFLHISNQGKTGVTKLVVH